MNRPPLRLIGGAGYPLGMGGEVLAHTSVQFIPPSTRDISGNCGAGVTIGQITELVFVPNG